MRWSLFSSLHPWALFVFRTVLVAMPVPAAGVRIDILYYNNILYGSKTTRVRLPYACVYGCRCAVPLLRWQPWPLRLARGRWGTPLFLPCPPLSMCVGQRPWLVVGHGAQLEVQLQSNDIAMAWCDYYVYPSISMCIAHNV